MKNNRISRKLRQTIFLKKKTILLHEHGGPQKRVTFLTFSHEVFGYYSHITVLFRIKMIRKFIHQCKMQRCSELFLIEEGFEYIYLHVAGGNWRMKTTFCSRHM